MYKITKNNIFSFVEIPNEILSEHNFSVLEKELRENVLKLNVSVFFNSELPTGEPEFWKISTESETILERDCLKIVEMSEVEKTELESNRQNQIINESFHNKRIKIFINDFESFLKMPESSYYIAYVDASPDIEKEIFKTGELESKQLKANIYLDYIKSEHLPFLENATFANGNKIFEISYNETKEATELELNIS